MKYLHKMNSLLLLGISSAMLTACGAGDNTGHNSSRSASSTSSSSSAQTSVERSSSSLAASSSSNESSSLSNSSASIDSSSLSTNSSSSESSSGAASSLSVTVTTLARTAALKGDGLRLDKNGNVFVGTSSGHQVFRVTPAGEVSFVATFATGSANGSYFDSKGNLYVANETAGKIQKITPEGDVSDFLSDMDGPAGIYIDKNDNLYVGMFGYSTPAAKVLKITQDKTITTYASGNGLANVVGITGDGNGRYFAANFYTGEIFEITEGNVVQLGASETRVNHMQYSNGYIYTPNPLNQVVRRMDLKGNFEVVAGTPSVGGSEDGEGAMAKFSRPNSIDISQDGKTIYILDFNTGDVRMISLKP